MPEPAVGSASSGIVEGAPSAGGPHGATAGQARPGDPRPAPGDRQDIRLAVVMNGGASLAIWIGGVTLELHHLVMSSHGHRSVWPTYASVLDLLWADARVDVIAGTSAGGLNGAFLALGLARDRDLALMRDLWHEHGGLEQLLRDPLGKNPPSLLQGDDYFLPLVREALGDVLGPDGNLPRDPGAPPADVATPIELILTGTLWKGRRSSFSDDLGTGITEVDYDATFRFANLNAIADGGHTSGDLADDRVIGQLAAAVRCTSSFPGAFEPHWVNVHATDSVGDQRWASEAGRANYSESQFLLDGGVLLNKPIRPALEAVYRQPAEAQVRRILAYVVPDPGESPTRTAASSQTHPEPPQAREVLLGVLTRLRSTDSVSRELTEIRTRNQEASSRRRARDRLSAAMDGLAGPLSRSAWPGYREVRLDHAIRTVGQLLAAGQPEGPGRWSEAELLTALRGEELRFVPADGADKGKDGSGVDVAVSRTGEAWDWGQTTVQRLGDMAIDVLKRAVWLAADPGDREQIAEQRRKLYGTLKGVHEDRRKLTDYWLAAPRGAADARISRIPRREGGDNAPAANTAALDAWLGEVLTGWDRMADPKADPEAGLRSRRALLYGQAQTLAQRLRESGGAIGRALANPNKAIDPDGTERQRLKALYDYLLADTPDDEVLERMLRLDVVQLCFSGATQEVEQEVELVQVSSRKPGRLTGVQLHHFGAFYRGTWRINDWLQGRMDGAVQIVRLLLSPERLRQRGYAVPADSPDAAIGEAAERLLGSIRAMAVPGTDPDAAWFEEQWKRDKDACLSEVRQVIVMASPDAGTAAPHSTAMEACARAIARPIQTGILREDLPALAQAIRTEGGDAPETSQGWLRNYTSEAVAGLPPAAALWRLWDDAGSVGGERIVADVGSDTFARTTTHAAAVFANNVSSVTKPRAVAAFLAAFRGYALTLWAMVTLLTRRSRFGTRAVELAVAAGGVLIAVAVLVPGMPLGFTLAGVLLLLAGVSAAALLTKQARGVGWRLLGAAVLTAAATGGYAYWDYTRNGSASAVWSLAIKAGVGVLLVLLGWWVARARPMQRKLPSSGTSPGSSRPETGNR